MLAKIKGFPTWPGIVSSARRMRCDRSSADVVCPTPHQLVGEEQTPREVLREKPKDKFVIRFFPKAD